MGEKVRFLYEVEGKTKDKEDFSAFVIAANPANATSQVRRAFPDLKGRLKTGRRSFVELEELYPEILPGADEYQGIRQFNYLPMLKGKVIRVR